MTPMSSLSEDPHDGALMEAISGFLATQNAPANSEYEYTRVDLDGDGRREGIVLFKLPHTYWCGWDGCGMAIFKADNQEFTPLSTVSNVRGPIYVSDKGHQGWRDIIIRTSGTHMPDKNIVLAYDGAGYPKSPLLAPTLQQKLSSLRTEKFFR